MIDNSAMYLEVSAEAGARFFGSGEDGPFVMVNLLRFRERADYSHAPGLEPAGGVTGIQAYDLYKSGIEPLLKTSGGEVLFEGAAQAFLIGPADERWDRVMLVRQASKTSFLAFASNPLAQTAGQHRIAALLDSRLLPVWQDPLQP